MTNIHDCAVHYGTPAEPESTLSNMAGIMIKLREQKDELENETKKINKRISDLEDRMFAFMIGEEMDSFAAHGYSFTPTVSSLASIPAAMKEDAFKELEAMGYEGLIKRDINSQTFRAFYRDQLNPDGEPPEWLKPFVTVYDKQSISVRRRG